MENQFQYDVALSFAGEDRDYVEKVAQCLKANNINLFYDNYNEVYLWGKDLYQHLDDLYKNKAKYCVVFTSKHYAEKLWTNHELKSAQERAIREKGKEYILPAKFDDTPVPGIRATTGYIDLKKKSPQQLCKIISDKLEAIEISDAEIASEEHNYQVYIPKLKKRFTDVERKKFVLDTFKYALGHFKAGLRSLEQAYEFIETDLEELSKAKFIATIYKYGELEQSCKIWLGSGFTDTNSISYSGGKHVINLQDTGYNENVFPEDDGHELYFRASMSFGDFKYGVNPSKLNQKDVATYLWGKFTEYLEN